MNSIYDYGRIMQDAFQKSIERFMDEDFGVTLDGSNYTEEEFQQFKREFINDEFSLVIDGYADVKSDLSDIFFLGAFPTVFLEGIEYIDIVEEIEEDLRNYEY